MIVVMFKNWRKNPISFGWDDVDVFFPAVLTYLPHKAVAEVSKDKEPIGRECAEFNWFES